MKTYTIYFELFSKKMKTTIKAYSEDHAKEILKNKIIIHKVEPDIVDTLSDMFGMTK